jgi:Ran GTPase-activating protein (RanGAP) involved in mRNA processing and transport
MNKMEDNKLDVLSLEDEYMDDNLICKLAPAIGRCRSLTTLKLKNNHFTSEGVAALASELGSSDALTHIDLSGNQIGKKGVNDLLMATRTWPESKLASLILSDCFKTGDALAAVETIVNELPRLCSVSTLVLNDNEIGTDAALRLADFLHGDSTLTTLDLSSNSIGAGGISIANALRVNSALQSLDLSENNMADSNIGMAFIACLNCYNTTLTKLALVGNGIGEAKDWGIDNILERNTLLHKLHSNNLSDAEKADKAHSEVFAWNEKQLGDQGASLVSRMLATNTTVKKLSLTNNNISVAGCRSLSGLLTANTNFAHLNLEGNEAGQYGCQVLAQAISVAPKLSFLSLKNNSIGSSGVMSLMSAFAQSHRQTVKRRSIIPGKPAATPHRAALHHLDLGSNFIGSEGVASLAMAMKSSLRLLFLSLRDNCIGAEGARELSTVLMSHGCPLSHLDLGENGLGDEGAIHIAAGLQHNTHLLRLELCGNKIAVEGTKAISRCLGVNKSLEQLSLRDNNLGDKGAKVLTTGMTKADEEEDRHHHTHFGLMHNKHLVKMDLWGNGIGDKGATSLIVGLQKNKTLKTLILGNNKLEDSKGTFAEALAPAGWKSSLTSLDLQYNSFTGDALKFLAKSLSDKKSTVRSLDLSRNKIMVGKEDVWRKEHHHHHHERRASHTHREIERVQQSREKNGKNLFDLLSKSHSLTDLNLRANNLRNAETQVLPMHTSTHICTQPLTRTLVSMQILAAALAKNTTLRSLDVSDNNVSGADGVQKLAKVLAKGKSLTKLDMRGNTLGDTGAQAIAKAFNHSHSLKSVDLGFNMVSDYDTHALVHASILVSYASSLCR